MARPTKRTKALADRKKQMIGEMGRRQRILNFWMPTINAASQNHSSHTDVKCCDCIYCYPQLPKSFGLNGPLS